MVERSLVKPVAACADDDRHESMLRYPTGADAMSATQDRGLCYYRNLVHTVYREARHIGAKGDPEARFNSWDPDLEPAIEAIVTSRSILDSLSIFRDINDEIVTSQIRAPYEQATLLTLPQLVNLFDQDGWRAGWGGLPWAAIGRLTIQLGDALDAQDDAAIDRLCNEAAVIEHNNGRLARSGGDVTAYKIVKWPVTCDE